MTKLFLNRLVAKALMRVNEFSIDKIERVIQRILGEEIESYSFDDLLLVPGYADFEKHEVDTSTLLTKAIPLNIPLISAAMDTVTEEETAITMAREGGVGFIHRNDPIDVQVARVDYVKRSTAKVVTKMNTVTSSMSVVEVMELINKKGFSSFPVVESGKLLGIVTRRDIEWPAENNSGLLVRNVMTPVNKLLAIDDFDNLSDIKCLELMFNRRVEQILVVNRNCGVAGMITKKDIDKRKKYPKACRDENERLIVGAAIGVGKEGLERTQQLLGVGVDVICIDTSHGYSKSVIKTVKMLKRELGKDVQVIAGNVATEAGAKALIEAGVDAVKIGIGPGSSCTTRLVGGAGIPQPTAIKNCCDYCNKKGIPMIADGGIRYPGDTTKAIGSGASSVMIGGGLAGTDESPGEIFESGGEKFKIFRGMGSYSAMKKGSKDRYYGKDVPEGEILAQGITGKVPYRGSLHFLIRQYVSGLKIGMGLCGCRDIETLMQYRKFVKISSQGREESRPHDVIATDENHMMHGVKT